MQCSLRLKNADFCVLFSPQNTIKDVLHSVLNYQKNYPFNYQCFIFVPVHNLYAF